MEQKQRFVILANTGRFYIGELCEQFGISRKTGYKYLERYAEGGLKALGERSHRPHRFPQRTDAGIEALILGERRLHSTWGPKKLHAVLQARHGVESPPAQSTIGEILRRHGLSARPRRKPGRYEPLNNGLTEPTQPNHVWTVDFKGWFVLGDGQRCDPLTVCDRHSRYVLASRAQPNQQYKNTLESFKSLMRHHGVPWIIRVDNGPPFASCGLGGLSSLSVWWLEQGISVEFMRPASPQENGSHERMHRDMKAETANPPSANLRAQQRRLERWRHDYNHNRPHEALGQRAPAGFYHRSERRLGENDKPLVYPRDCEVKTLSHTGQLSHEGKNYHVGEAFANKRVGVRLNESGQTELLFANVVLGTLTYDPQRKSYGASAAYIAPARRKPARGGEADRLPSTPSAQSGKGREPSPLP